MSRPVHVELGDRKAREEALNTVKSILVQAPAGSGKTELLTLRFLKLLATVEEPEQILAITFTRPATAEMQHRVLKRLEEAKSWKPGEVASSEEEKTLLTAKAALENSERRGWRLLEQPQRLNIQTIDSLCMRIARQMPLRARLGGILQPTEDARPLYRSAARRTFDRLGGDDIELNEALEALLSLRDSNLQNCETLLAEMLASRDQWGRAFLLSGDVDWERVRAALEAPFQREIKRILGRAHELLSAHPDLVRELLALGDYACGGAERKIEIGRLAGLTALPDGDIAFVQHWECICELLLTLKDRPRKTYTIREGFPLNDGGQKARMLELAATIESFPEFVDTLSEVRYLPLPTYSEEQWKTLRHMFVALRQAVHELDAVFTESRTVDFVEISTSALQVLHDGLSTRAGDGPAPSIRHLLVDEFQDTSRRQHELIVALLHGWHTDGGRTFFLVGDPMQSIYMFRQAEVELFDLVKRSGFATGTGTLSAKALQLTTNFRSNAGVVDPLNNIFETVFPYGAKGDGASVDFLAGEAWQHESLPGAFEIHAGFLVKPSPVKGNSPALQNADEPADRSADRQEETFDVLQVVQRHLPRIEDARRRNEEFTLAILANVKQHLVSIAAALREQEIPFRAIELEKLGARQEIIDLQSLTRALLHQEDRIAWLAMLRAPWCGLDLHQLHRLCGTDALRPTGVSIQKQLIQNVQLLDDSSKQRVLRILSVLRSAVDARPSQTSFSSWVERTWYSLGGPACVDATGYENAMEYFRMLEQVAPDGIAATGEEMKDQLERLFAAPDPATSERCGVQLMTIHKAKGLGFNVVLLPGLDRCGGSDPASLIRYLERSTAEGTELLAAPIGSKGEDASPINRWVQRQKESRQTEERKRLLYVACTRAREELHLFGTVSVTDAKSMASPRISTPESGSLLRTAWPALKAVFEEKYWQPANAQSIRAQDKVLEFPSIVADRLAFEETVDLAATAAHGTLQRLPSGWKPVASGLNVVASRRHSGAAVRDIDDSVGTLARLQSRGRPEAAHFARTLGTTVHILLEHVTQLLALGTSEETLHAALPSFYSRAVALARHNGLIGAEAESCARSTAGALEKMFADPHGLWLLKPHVRSQTESSWTGSLEGPLQTKRIDRSFFAGPEPLTEGEEYLWIVDYKTAEHSESGLEKFLEAEKALYQEQLEDYGTMMRLVHGSGLQLRLGLYYPLLKRLIYWAA